MNLVISISAFIGLGALWLGFGAALILNRALLDTVWQALRGLPLVFQVVVWLLVLPVTAGLWIWEMPWPIGLRLILVAGLGMATLYAFFPRKA